MLQSGQIYYIKNFNQGENSQKKNRYCVILTIREVDCAVIFHKVTSKTYCDSIELEPKGNIVNDKKDIFFFPKNIIIGKNGFFFKIDSYIHMGVWEVSEFAIEKFQEFESKLIDIMIDDWFNDLLYFIYKSDHIKQKYQVILEPELERLNNS
jgi:hypothetical protein